MADDAPYRIDARAVRQHYDRHAPTAAGCDAVAREVSARMLERFDYIRVAPATILDLGCGHGADRASLASRFAEAHIVGADASLPPLALQRGSDGGLLKRLIGRARQPALVAADARALPFARGSIDLVWSNLMLQWLDDPAPALAEMHRCLRVDGLLMFSALGPDSLKELRSALPPTSVHRFIDMHDLGDALVKAGFGDPVMDMQVITVTYANVETLLADLRQGGHANARADRPRGLRGRHRWQSDLARLESGRRDGNLPLTLELVFGHAWKMPPKADEHGRSIIRFAERPTP
ncbi:MAG: methyltransferase domain-containing protein [Rhodocyclaceae bacterium]|nr:methyltransferase domain-containing protein [Rhodocyclaceae bacterium]